jgi:glycerophosphoryl diester phosphodiesterase
VDKNVWETAYDEVKKLDAGSSFSEKFKGEPVPCFETLLDSVKGKIKLNIELKDNGHQQKLAERVVAAVEKKGMTSQVIITSFNRALIKKVRALDKDLKVGYIFSVYPADEDVFKADIDILSMGYKLVNEESVRKANESGKKILAWTVNKPEDMERLSKFRIHSIVTNYPDKLQEMLKK